MTIFLKSVKNNAAQIQNIKILATLFLLAEGSVLFFQ